MDGAGQRTTPAAEATHAMAERPGLSRRGCRKPQIDLQRVDVTGTVQVSLAADLSANHEPVRRSCARGDRVLARVVRLDAADLTAAVRWQKPRCMFGH